MILLDTNVVFEAMKPRPCPAVLAWLNEQVAETLYLSIAVAPKRAQEFRVLPPKTQHDLGNLAGEGVYELDKKRAFSDNGSEYINKRVADLLEKLFIAFTPEEDALLRCFKACVASGLFAEDGLVTEGLRGRYRWNELRRL